MLASSTAGSTVADLPPLPLSSLRSSSFLFSSTAPQLQEQPQQLQSLQPEASVATGSWSFGSNASEATFSNTRASPTRSWAHSCDSFPFVRHSSASHSLSQNPFSVSMPALSMATSSPTSSILQDGEKKKPRLVRMSSAASKKQLFNETSSAPTSQRKLEPSLSPVASLTKELEKAKINPEANPNADLTPRTQRRLFTEDDHEPEEQQPVVPALPLDYSFLRSSAPDVPTEPLATPRPHRETEESNNAKFKKPVGLPKRHNHRSGSMLELSSTRSKPLDHSSPQRPMTTKKRGSMLQINSGANKENAAPADSASAAKKTRLDEGTIVIPPGNSPSKSATLLGSFSQSFTSLPRFPAAPILPVENGNSDLGSLSPHTVLRLLRGEFKETVKRFLIVDCRFPYEYEGGHIRGAVNVMTPGELDAIFTNTNGPVPCPGHSDLTIDPNNPENASFAIIFHCEFSSLRGPRLAGYLRSWDREQNGLRWPGLFYPQVFVLAGGYKRFYHEQGDDFQSYCEPRSYRPMDEPPAPEVLKEHLRILKQSCNNSRRTRSCSLTSSDSGLRIGRSMSTPNIYVPALATAAAAAVQIAEERAKQMAPSGSSLWGPSNLSLSSGSISERTYSSKPMVDRDEDRLGSQTAR